MRAESFMAIVVVPVVMLCALTSVYAQQIQLPTLQVGNKTEVTGTAIVEIYDRGTTPGDPIGRFKIGLEARCHPPNYPEGTLKMSVDLSDGFTGVVESNTFYQLTSMGKHTPTAFLSGPCNVSGYKGCRFWLMIVDNKRNPEAKTPDIISFLIMDGKGNRVAYGTGPVVEKDIKVAESIY